MRLRIRQRFGERVQKELQLTDKQSDQLRATTETFAQRRRELRTREHAMRRALAEQLRPGIAAHDDSVAKLTEQLVDLRVRYAETFRGELKELSGYLSPVQRARLFSMRERLFRAADRAHDGPMPMGRREGRFPRRPGSQLRLQPQPQPPQPVEPPTP